MMRLRHLTLEKIVDTAYFCGFEKMPVSVLIAAPPGSGKSWCTCALRDVEGVQYISKVYSPSEHRKMIGDAASRTRLLINDDLGLMARWNQTEYFSSFCMAHDGELLFRQFRAQTHAQMRCSIVLCCTLDYFYANVDTMRAIGLLDRVIPIILDLSDVTRERYKSAVMQSDLQEREPPQRYPSPPDETRIVKTEAILRNNVGPRELKNLRRMSLFLTDDEVDELIAVTHNESKYEV